MLAAIGENTFCPEIGGCDMEGGVPFNYFGRLVKHIFDHKERQYLFQDNEGVYTFVTSGSQRIYRLAHCSRNRRLRLNDAVIKHNTQPQLTSRWWCGELFSPWDWNCGWV